MATHFLSIELSPITPCPIALKGLDRHVVERNLIPPFFKFKALDFFAEFFKLLEGLREKAVVDIR